MVSAGCSSVFQTCWGTEPWGFIEAKQGCALASVPPTLRPAIFPWPDRPHQDSPEPPWSSGHGEEGTRHEYHRKVDSRGWKQSL